MTDSSAVEIALLAQRLLAGIVELEPSEIPLDADLDDEVGVDSLLQLELMIDLESELGVRLSSEEWREARTLRQLAELLVAGEPAES